MPQPPALSPQSSVLSPELSALLERLENKTALIGIVGLGYVGLPLLLRYVEAGYRVLGFDIDADKVDKLRNGQTYIKHFPAAAIAATHHDAFDWVLIRQHAQLIVDTRGVYLEPAANVVKA